MPNYNESLISLMLPVMKELEAVGINPILNMSGEQTVDKTEERYKAITRAKEKYPKWYKVVSGWIAKVL